LFVLITSVHGVRGVIYEVRADFKWFVLFSTSSTSQEIHVQAKHCTLPVPLCFAKFVRFRYFMNARGFPRQNIEKRSGKYFNSDEIDKFYRSNAPFVPNIVAFLCPKNKTLSIEPYQKCCFDFKPQVKKDTSAFAHF
jgi:hypothetical protein